MMQFAGAARYAYNWAIDREKEAYESGNSFIGYAELCRDFTKHKADNDWLYTISNEVTKQAIKDACYAYQRFFKKQSNPPKHKSRKRSKPAFYQSGFEIDRDLNASLNLYRYCTVSSTGINVCGVSHKTAVVTTKQDTMKQKSNITLSN